MAPAPTTDISEFKKEILSLADTIKHFYDLKCGHVTPTQSSAKLLKLDKALTVALQHLLSLDLCHEFGQDVETQPYDGVLAQNLRSERVFSEWWQDRKGRIAREVEKQVDANYPTNLIQEIRRLRDAARTVQKGLKPKRGNSRTRDPKTAIKWEIAYNMVFRYRSRFGASPPSTKTGSSGLVELLEQAFERAGADNGGASYWLRTAVIHHQGVVKLPR